MAMVKICSKIKIRGVILDETYKNLQKRMKEGFYYK